MIAGTPIERAARYRAHAQQVRSRAAEMHDPVLRRQMERLGALWESMADREAARAVPGQPAPEAVLTETSGKIAG